MYFFGTFFDTRQYPQVPISKKSQSPDNLAAMAMISNGPVNNIKRESVHHSCYGIQYPFPRFLQAQDSIFMRLKLTLSDSLDVKKAIIFDNIPARAIKVSKIIIAPILILLINMSNRLSSERSWVRFLLLPYKGYPWLITTQYTNTTTNNHNQ